MPVSKARRAKLKKVIKNSPRNKARRVVKAARARRGGTRSIGNGLGRGGRSY